MGTELLPRGNFVAFLVYKQVIALASLQHTPVAWYLALLLFAYSPHRSIPLIDLLTGSRPVC